MHDNFFLYLEVQSSTVYASLHSLTPIHVNLRAGLSLQIVERRKKGKTLLWGIEEIIYLR